MSELTLEKCLEICKKCENFTYKDNAGMCKREEPVYNYSKGYYRYFDIESEYNRDCKWCCEWDKNIQKQIDIQTEEYLQVCSQIAELEKRKKMLRNDMLEFFNRNPEIEKLNGFSKGFTSQMKSISLPEFNLKEGVELQDIKVSIPVKYKLLYPELYKQSDKLNVPKASKEE